MDDQLLAQLDRRIDEHHQCLCQRLDDLAEAIRATHTALGARLDAHELYHRRNEHRWGAFKLAQRYPFRLALGTFALAWLASTSTEGSLRLAEALFQKFLSLLLH